MILKRELMARICDLEYKNDEIEDILEDLIERILILENKTKKEKK